MDEKDDIIEKQIAAAMIDTTENAVNSINSVVESLGERATVTELKLTNLESDVERLELVIDILDDKLNTMATKQDLREHMNYLEDEFKGMLTKSMYIVFALFFIVFLLMYLF